MVKKKAKAKKKKSRKHQTPLDKIRKQIDKLEALHEKELSLIHI